MNILVLGSSGQIGKPLCKLLQDKDHIVTYFDKKLDKTLMDLSKKEWSGDYLNFCVSIADVVVFLAFEVGGSKFLLDNDKTIEYISENVRLMDYTFSVLKRENKPVLFASSQMSNMHSTNYGFLKDLGERYTKTLNKGYICRFWNVYGYEDPTDPKSHVITDFIHMAKSGTINMRTTGEEERQFLYTEDSSKALLHWCENYHQYDKDQYIDITSFKWDSIYNVAKIISKYIPCEIIRGEAKDNIQNGIRNTPSEYIKKFWCPSISLDQGIGYLCKRSIA